MNNFSIGVLSLRPAIVTSALVLVLMFHPSVASEAVTWQRAIDRDNATALWRLMPEVDVFKANEKGKTALMSAAKLGDRTMIEALQRRGLALTSRSNTGGTTLMYAALGDQPDMIRYIHSEVGNKGFLNFQSTNGWTALMIASAKGFDRIVRVLVELGANPSLADVYQWSPLMRAIDNRHSRVVEFLLSLDQLETNAVNENGSTALHIAALSGDIPATRLLLRRPELAVDVVDKQGKSPEAIALEEGHKQLAELLRTVR